MSESTYDDQDSGPTNMAPPGSEPGASNNAADRNPDDYGPADIGDEADINPQTGTEFGAVDS